jgi:excisionase family DNA binding protein
MTDSATNPTLVVPRAEERPTITVEEAARFLGLGRGAGYNAAARGDLPTIRIGRRLLVPTATLRTMLGLDPNGGTS